VLSASTCTFGATLTATDVPLVSGSVSLKAVHLCNWSENAVPPPRIGRSVRHAPFALRCWSSAPFALAVRATTRTAPP
jgi:hypothetical protein